MPAVATAQTSLAAMNAAVPQPNTRVIHRAHPEYGFGLVRYIEEDALGETRLQVAFDHLDQLQALQPEEVEQVADPLADAAAGRWGDLAAFKRKLAAGLVIGEHNLTSCFTRSVVQPLPHQVHVLDRVVSGNRFGHVLADDVGLGKTIEAGLVISSLLRSDPPQRILIVCPAGLALQWQDELEDHFNLHFSILGTNFDGKLAASWRSQTAVIAPIDRIKREEYRELLQQVGVFELVICDEAHRLTARRNALTNDLEKTANYRLFEFLVQSRLIKHVENPDRTPRSPRLLLLSGTPHQGDDERFLRLLHLARPDLFHLDEREVAEQLTRETLTETLTRTPKSRGVDWDGHKLFKGHDTTTIEVPWTLEELEVSRLLTQYILKSLENACGGDRSFALVVALVMHTFHKIAASSWRALAAALTRRAEGLRGRQQTLADLLTEEDDDQEERPQFTKPLQQFFADEQTLLDLLLERIRLLPGDSKWERCGELLRQIEEREAGTKVLFFTQYRATQGELCGQLAALFPGARVEVIHGGTPPELRREARRRFEREARFLVSTEAGGEGINLQKACHVMVNYDLPWNPMRLQQRIGRLDRYGQKQRVQVFNLRVPESWDARISQRITERLEVIQRTMNLAGLNEDYREMLLGEVAERMDPTSLFSRSMRGEEVSDATLDGWIREAVCSADRLKKWLGNASGFNGDLTALRPTLTADDFKMAFALALERHGLRLQETRNSASQFVPGVYHFRLPDAFRDPVFRPERTCHVVFDREVFQRVRDEDLGVVRGQPITPVLAGFGEPVTDWLFQSTFEALGRESAFTLQVGKNWQGGSGWLIVYGLRWRGSARRLSAPDSLAMVFCGQAAEPRALALGEVAGLIGTPDLPEVGSTFSASADSVTVTAARAVAQGSLRKILASRPVPTAAQVGLALLCCARLVVQHDACERNEHPA
jgi:superfamily II DNA or RNA helicase